MHGNFSPLFVIQNGIFIFSSGLCIKHSKKIYFLYTNDVIVKDDLLNYFKPLDYIITNDTDNVVPKEKLF